MPSGRKPAHNREQILSIGAELFTRHGYHATGIKEILSTCQVSKGSFYNFFTSKEHFALEIIEHYQSMELNRWQQQFGQLSGSHFDKISQMLEAEISRYESQNAETCGCLLANLSGEVSQSSDQFRDAILRSILEVQQFIANDLRLCQLEGTVRIDLSADILAELVWDHWQGALLRSKVLNSVTPLRNHQSFFLQLLRVSTP